MRKKYLSALLFGALLVTSAGTFTSCKDYDDDINNLQEQITANADAIKKLQEMIGDGKFVTNIVSEGNGLKITWNDNQSTVIENVVNGEDQKGDVVTIDPETGEIKINDKGTGFFASKGESEEEVKLPYVNEEGILVLVDAEGKEVVTGIRVAPVTAVIYEDGSADITIIGADGESQTIHVPSAVSNITSMSLGDNTHNPIAYSTIFGSNAFVLTTETFVLNGPSSDKGNFPLTSASQWMGNKKLPANNSVVYASPTSIDLRVNPVNVEAENLDFYLTNTKNEDLLPVVLTAKAEDGDKPLSNTNGRAANTGNGLYTLSMDNVVVSKDENEKIYDALIEAQNGGYVHSVNAEHSFRTEYKINVGAATPEKLTTITLKQGTTVYTAAKNITNANTSNKKYKVGIPVNVLATEASALYDMYLDADKSDRDVYELSFDQDNHTFTIGKNPDVSTVDASFNLIVYTVANNGSVNKATIKVVIDTEINAGAEYGLHEHDVNKNNNSNYFSIDLSTMKTALGDNLNQWLQNVDLTKTVIAMDTKEDGDFTSELSALEGSTIGKYTGITAGVVSSVLAKDNSNYPAIANRNNANFIQIDVNNSIVDGLELDKTYYIKATFRTTAGDVLNSIIVPVEFHAPALSELFSIKEAYLDKNDNVINAYFYNTNVPNGKTTASTAVTLDRFFNESVADAKVLFTNDKVGNTNKNGEELFTMTWFDGSSNQSSPASTVYFGKDNSYEGSTVTNYTTIDFDASAPGVVDGQAKNGYGESVIVKVQKDYYNNEKEYFTATTQGWKYTNDGDNEYSFKIRLMSPIYEGSVNPVSGNTINISANDWVNGARITDAMIKGADYNKNTYNVVPDKYIDGETIDWANPQIDEVTPKRDEQNLIKSVTNSPATKDSKGNIVNGAFVVKGENITNTTEVKMPVQVKDVWGYILEEKVSVTIQMNE